MENQYPETANINYLSILDYLKNYGNLAYCDPDKASTPEERTHLLEVKQKGQDAVGELKKIVALCKKKFGLGECPLIKWLDGSNTKTRGYLWAQMKYSDRKDNPVSISVAVEKKDATARYVVKLEIKVEAANDTKIEQYHSHLDLPLNHGAGLTYMACDAGTGEWKLRTESQEQLRDELNAGKLKRVQIIKYIEQQPGQTNEYFEQAILAAVEAILPYYNHVVGKEDSTPKVEELNEMQLSHAAVELNKNLILYGLSLIHI